jgi:hypothetical protein
MTLTVRLTQDDENKLEQIVQALHVEDRSGLIRSLIHEKWKSLQPSKTFVERRGGHPEILLHGKPNSSQRNIRARKRAE